MQRPDCNNSFTIALIAVGSNLSDRGAMSESIVRDAIAEVAARAGNVLSISSLYRTPAFPPGSGPDFVNAAFALDWPDGPEPLLALLHEVEAQFNRTRGARWQARTLDLDLIALGDRVCPDAEVQTRWRDLPAQEAAQVAPDQLILPHPRMQERGFVLVPLADVAPEWRHPLTGRTVAAMLSQRPDKEIAEIHLLSQE
ncbi:2-amino-4-hydroxy-6-hydroxymethyldihydropteridine diphosphokinase [Nioella halotolerans]|uniref:2-amino-4-hydroxy-6- hydroxymethyldihydropteridine diphosphokinase n=1 Tax=Nioella halotolerans TaxID=2303578 RepID=UPI0026856CD8